MNTQIFNELSTNLFLILGSSTFAFLLVLLLTEPFTKTLKKFQFGQQIREETMDGKDATLFKELHKHKKNTPTMGGLLIWGSVILVSLLTLLIQQADIKALEFINFSLINRQETYVPLFTLLSFGFLGLVDDIFNIKQIGKVKGIRSLPKISWMIALSGLGAWWFYSKLGYDTVNLLGMNFDLGIFYIPLFIFFVTGFANAVNITDGLDGLAGGLSIISFLSLGLIAMLNGLWILTALCATIAGAIAGFLWNNIPPAKFFMGDTGALALGATMAVIAFMIDEILLLPFIGFIFVIEVLSVIIQLSSKKIRGKKVFHIAPIHHHFEYIGWPEFRVTMRFWTIGVFSSLIGLILTLANII
jgi:phospho-N-acetylmuramoyl-pentapeptide-transferase